MVLEFPSQIPESIADIVDVMGQHGVRTAASAKVTDHELTRFGAGHATLDGFLEGGLATGAVSEWGMPAGQGAREIALAIIARATADRNLVLWVNGQDGLDVYPPAWSARGVDLRFIRFVSDSKPLESLKPVFLEPLFRLIVLDSPRHLGSEEWAFIARQVRTLDAHIMVLQDFFLSGRRGNIWARLRVNCKQRGNGLVASAGSGWRLETIRGAAHQPLEIGPLDM